MSEAEKLWKALKALCATLDREGADSHSVGSYIGLRILAHPELKPYCDDPLLNLAGERPSLDALGPVFQQKLAQAIPTTSEIGSVWGALYLPAEGRAATLRIRVCVCEGESELLVLRPLSPELSLSVQSALRAARVRVDRQDGLVLLDIEAEGLEDSHLGFAAGDSLGLPLALAFVSAFQKRALPLGLGATGAIGRSGIDRIDKVGWVDKKRESLAERGIRLIAPPEITTLRQAWEQVNGEQSPIKGELEEPLTPLLGREREILRLENLLSQPDIRLVTVTGPGGVGKTRLALHLLRSLSDRYSGGAWTLSLAEKIEGGEIKELLANVLGISVDELSHRLAGRATLLLIDNAETEPRAAEKIGELLRFFPELVCLVTSRLALGVRGEYRFDLDGLPLSEGVLLFSQRATASCDSYSEDATLVENIVQRLDGLPLAIEIAASRVRMLSLAELYSRLNRALSLLSTRSKDLPERQRTIRATLEWSYQSLESRERHVLETLSVFADGFSELAAIAVTGDEDIFEALVRLEEHSLLHHKEGRYFLLSLVREFAREYLVSHGKESVVADAHAAFYARFLQEQRREALRIGQAEPVRALTRELGNLRATFTWLQKSPDFRLLRFVADISNFLEIRGLEREREIWIRTILPLLSEETPIDIAVLTLLPLARITRQRGDMEEANGFVEELIRLTDSEKNSQWRAATLAERSIIKSKQNKWDSALEDSEVAYKIHSDNGNTLGKIQILNKRGLVFRIKGEIHNARHNFELALELGSGPESVRDRVFVLENLIELDIEVGDAISALNFICKQHQLRLILEDYIGVATTLYLCGRALRLMGEFSAARLAMTAAFMIRKKHWKADFVDIERDLSELGGAVTVPNAPCADEEWLNWELPIPDSLRQALSE